MSSGPGVLKARQALDMWLAGGGKVRLWAVAPAWDGTGGTEVTGGGYAPQTALFNAAVAGTGGQIAKATQSGSVVFSTLTVASSDVAALSIEDPSDGSFIALDAAWVPPSGGTWAAGASPMFSNLVVAYVPV